MEELTSLIKRTQAGDLDAFGMIVTKFQDMAVGYAHSILGDFHLAEDAAQEAFIQAYRDLYKLREPSFFPGWFRKIVFKYCDRLTRKKRVESIPLEAAVVMPSAGKSPAEIVQEQEMKDMVLAAIQALPDNERVVTTLFYINGYSQNEIADFLEVPVTTVNSRLHYSRKRLKERLSTMVKDHLQEQRPSKDERFANKVKDALSEIDGYYSEAKFHQGAISEIASLVPEANHNIRVITRTAYLASKFGYHTGPLMDIAKMAAKLDHECEELSELAELAVLNRGGTGVVRLAELAANAQSEEEKHRIREEIEWMKTTADYASVEEGLQAQAEREKQAQAEREERPRVSFPALKEQAKSQEQKEALNEIEGYFNEAAFHGGAILGIAGLVPEAEHNIRVITRTAYLASVFGYHTKPLMDIANIASTSDCDCEELFNLAELSVLKLSESKRLVELAELAAKAQSEEEKNHIREEIEKLKATADYASIEEALEAQAERNRRERPRESFPVLKEQAKSQEQKDALSELEIYHNGATFGGGATLGIAGLVPEADHNIRVITRTAYLASRFGYHTKPLIDIAKMAAMLDHECEELYDIAELVAFKLSGTKQVMELAELAAKAQSEQEKNHIREEIKKLKATADYASIEEALQAKAERRERQKREAEIVFIPIPEGVDLEQLKQRARDFLQALVDNDFERAYEVARTRYEWLEQHDTYSNVVRLISVGEPFRRKGPYASGKGVHIPFEIELANGRIRRACINIRWDNPEGEWRFDGGL